MMEQAVDTPQSPVYENAPRMRGMISSLTYDRLQTAMMRFEGGESKGGYVEIFAKALNKPVKAAVRSLNPFARKQETLQHRSFDLNLSKAHDSYRALVEWLSGTEMRLQKSPLDDGIELNAKCREELRNAAAEIPTEDSKKPISTGPVGELERAVFVLRHFNTLSPQARNKLSGEHQAALNDPALREDAIQRMEDILLARSITVGLRHELMEVDERIIQVPQINTGYVGEPVQRPSEKSRDPEDQSFPIKNVPTFIRRDGAALLSKPSTLEPKPAITTTGGVKPKLLGNMLGDRSTVNKDGQSNPKHLTIIPPDSRTKAPREPAKGDHQFIGTGTNRPRGTLPQSSSGGGWRGNGLIRTGPQTDNGPFKR